MGRCVAIAGRSIDINFEKEIPKDEIVSIINRSLLISLEDAYKIMLLKKINGFNYLLKQNQAEYRDLKVFREDYFLSENYILGLLDFSYGTVRDLYNKIEEICSEFINKKSMKKRFENSQIILSSRHEEENYK